jgi:hypothetical protein
MAKQYMLAGSVKEEQHNAARAYATANGHTMSYLISSLINNSGIMEWYAAGGIGRLEGFAKAPLNHIEPALIRAIHDFATRYGRDPGDIANTLLRFAIDEMHRRERQNVLPEE